MSAGAIKHYLREGLLGGDAFIVRKARNMAWYRPELVERACRSSQAAPSRCDLIGAMHSSGSWRSCGASDGWPAARADRADQLMRSQRGAAA